MTVARRTVKTADYDRFVHQQPDNNTFLKLDTISQIGMFRATAMSASPCFIAPLALGRSFWSIVKLARKVALSLTLSVSHVSVREMIWY